MLLITTKKVGSIPPQSSLSREWTGLLKMLEMMKFYDIMCFKDVPEPWQLGFQDAAGPVMEEIIFFMIKYVYINNYYDYGIMVYN